MAAAETGGAATSGAATGGDRVQAVHRTGVAWMDTDAAGHHHNTAIVRYVEAAEAALVGGLGLDDYFGAAPRVRFEADFTATHDITTGQAWAAAFVLMALTEVVTRLGTIFVRSRLVTRGQRQQAGTRPVPVLDRTA